MATPLDELRRQRRALAYARGRARLAAAFDDAVGLCIARTELSTRHIPRTSLEYARCLLRDGGDAGLARAVRLIARALEAQELEPGHPHHGGFRFALEDEEVTGLNVTSFVLQQLVAIWVEHGVRLPEALRALILERARLALDELTRVDVALRYTNPALMDLANTILWGEVLDDASRVAAGMAKLDAWIALTARSGAPFEYNSPTYVAVDLTVLATLAALTRHRVVRLKARVMEARLWLHALLHYHAPTGRLAGPHSRAYHAAMHGAPDGLAALFWQELGLDAPVAGSPYLQAAAEPGGVQMALADYACPPHVALWAREQARLYPYSVRETADLERGVCSTTYCTADYALGTASRTYTMGQGGFDIEHEANHCILYYCHPPPDDGGGGVGGSWRTLYTRFVVNDRYLGSIVQRAIQSARTNFYDQGLFAGHQHRTVAIALYGLELADEGLRSVETLVVLPGPVRPSALYAGDRRLPLDAIVAGQPERLPDDTWIVVEDGAVWVGIWPLRRDQLGKRRDLEARLLPTGELVVAMPHYRGPEKWFWEYASPAAAFYRRNVRAGLLLVVGSRAEHPTREAFAEHLARAAITDELDGAGVRTVGYRNADAWLELRYDLVRNEPVQRLVDGQPVARPALESPWAVQTSAGFACAGEAALSTAPGVPAVLFARDRRSAPGRVGRLPLAGSPPAGGEPWVWEALLLGDHAGPVRLDTPAGAVECPAFGFGSISVEAALTAEDAARATVPAAVRIRCAALGAPLRLPPAGPTGAGYAVILNGADVSARVAWTADGAVLGLTA